MGFDLKDIQIWLGHSDIKVSASIYTHLETKRKVETVLIYQLIAADGQLHDF